MCLDRTKKAEPIIISDTTLDATQCYTTQHNPDSKLMPHSISDLSKLLHYFCYEGQMDLQWSVMSSVDSCNVACPV